MSHYNYHVVCDRCGWESPWTDPNVAVLLFDAHLANTECGDGAELPGYTIENRAAVEVRNRHA